MFAQPLLLAVIVAVIDYPQAAVANVEKAIFVTPPAAAAEATRDKNSKQEISAAFERGRVSSFAGCLESLSPANSSLRQNLPVAFPSTAAPHGLSSWYVLEHLRPSQRHEVRVCWAATVRIRSPGTRCHAISRGTLVSCSMSS